MRITSILASIILIVLIMTTYAFFCLRNNKKKVWTIFAVIFSCISIYAIIFTFQISLSEKINEKTVDEVYKITEITQNTITYGEDLCWPVSHVNNIIKNDDKHKNELVITSTTFDRSAKLFGVFDVYLSQESMKISIYVEDYVYEILSNKGQYIYQETKED